MLIIDSTPSVTEELSDSPNILAQEPGITEDEAPKWKDKGKAVAARNDDGSGFRTELTVDWTKYEPPTGLYDTASSKSEMVIQIIQESIDKVKARITEKEERRKAEAEMEILKQEKKLGQENEKGITTGTADTTSADKSSEAKIELSARITTSAAIESINTRGLLAPERPRKSKKLSLMKLLRRLNNPGERGESSATGAARHSGVSQSNFELGTNGANKRFISEISKKTTANSPSSSISSVHQIELECVSCLDDFSPKEMIRTPCHSYCKPCFLRLIYTTCENEQRWPPKCCLNPIPAKTIILNVDDELKNTYHDRAAEWNLPVSERVYCSRPTCSIWIRPYEINRARNVARCSEGHWTCIICHGLQHESDNCPQDRDMMRTDELAEEEGWKRCYGCHAYVEHREACHHMSCRCGAEFCYVCGARWRTCKCTMEQLAGIKREAETRRQARLNREAHEEVELQEALRLVEELEREEAFKAELLRQEQERLTEERRKNELKEQIRREKERRKAVEVKFHKLREVFANINELQRIIVQCDHSTQEANLETQGVTALKELIEKQKTGREKLQTDNKAKLSKWENVFEREYVARVTAEQRIEEQYQNKLKEYWSCKKDGEAKMAAAMKELKSKMDDGFRKWEKWRDNELTGHRWNVKEEQAIKEELMREAQRRLVEKTRKEQNVFLLRKTAELRWVDVIVEERNHMLTDMEVDEIENGEDVDAWFAEDGLDDSSADGADSLKEFRIPGAFT